MTPPRRMGLSRGLLIDGSSPSPVGLVDVLIEGDTIRKVSAEPLRVADADVIDLEGAALLPGLGVIAPGARADMIVVDGDPLTDIALLGRSETIRLIVQGGKIKASGKTNSAGVDHREDVSI